MLPTSTLLLKFSLIKETTRSFFQFLFLAEAFVVIAVVITSLPIIVHQISSLTELWQI